MQQRTNPDIDIVNYILEAVLKEKPEDTFCGSLLKQYRERGGLSKKQLEGLQGKAMRIQGIHPGRLATLEAIIKKKHVTHRSAVTPQRSSPAPDSTSDSMIAEILEKYPGHKRVLLFKSMFAKDKLLGEPEKSELLKFHRLLIKA